MSTLLITETLVLAQCLKEHKHFFLSFFLNKFIGTLGFEPFNFFSFIYIFNER